MTELPAVFLNRMKAVLGGEFENFLQSYSDSAVRGIRVNTLKISAGEFEKISPFKLEGNVPWEQNGFYVDGEGLGKTLEHAAGLYYVQEPSAMCAAPQLEVKRGERVLDLCSAPGGKGTRLAEYLSGDGVLVLNEINVKRCGILRENVERLGIRNAVTTCAAPEQLAKIFPSYFDKILVDAPCSGEGMFKKEENAIPEWSEENVKLCAQRQSDILSSAAEMLATGGRIVYSTCTFAAEEDEGQVENFLKNHKDFTLIKQEKLYPHKIRGEGHFFAVLEKCGGERRDIPHLQCIVKDKTLLNLFREFAESTLRVKFENITQFGGNLFLTPDCVPDVLTCLKQNGINCRIGVLLGGYSRDEKRFEPSHALAACLKRGEVLSVDVDERTAINYLRGLTFACSESLKGWCAVTYKGFPLGWCKAVQGVAKNHLPKGLRI